MPISLRAASGGGNGMRLAAGQTWQRFGATSNDGFGSLQASGININTTNTILSLTGKYNLHYLSMTGLTIGIPVVINLTIDGVAVFSGSITPTATTISLFGVGGGDLVSPVNISSSLSLTAQSTGVTSVAFSSKVFAVV